MTEICDQCKLDLDPESNDYAFVIGTCLACGQVHPLGVVHMLVCALDFNMGRSAKSSQMRRAGALGLN